MIRAVSRQVRARRFQQSWTNTGGTVRLGGRRLFGEHAIVGALVAVVAVDVLMFVGVALAVAFLYHAQGVSPSTGRIQCRIDGSFCYGDPVPTIDAIQLALIVYAAVLLGSVIFSIAMRRGMITVLICQLLLLAFLFAHGLSGLHAAEHRQQLLRECHYGADGNCPGIRNLAAPAP
jgi:hypothetical protein